MGQMGCSSAFVQHLLLSLGLFCCFLLGRVESYGHISMKIRVGILGLPNVGKSTLFNALAKKSIAEAANYPFCECNSRVVQFSQVKVVVVVVVALLYRHH
ncbi:unnamed protein product [Heterosigma akashiwo]